MIYFNVILQAKSDFKNILSTEMEKGTTKATLESTLLATQQVLLSPLESYFQSWCRKHQGHVLLAPVPRWIP